MSLNDPQLLPAHSGLIKKQTLSESELTDIQQLAEISNTYEGLRMRLFWDMLRKRSGEEFNDFLYYEAGKLVGYLTMDSFGVEQKEITGMVHPDYRRRGIFRALLDAAKEESKRRGIEKLLLVCESSSRSGQAFVQALGASLDHSEHEMVLGKFQDKFTFDERLLFRKAVVGDIESIASILAADDGNVEQTEKWVTQDFQDPNSHFYIATLGEGEVSCGEAVGCLRLDEMDQEVGIYGFAICPDYRGRGYGRQMLEEAIRLLQAQTSKPIMLDVDTDNTRALNLYSSSGFQTRTTFGYWTVML